LFNFDLAKQMGSSQAWSVLVSGKTQWRGKFGIFEPRRGQWVYGDKQGKTLGVLDDRVSTHYGELSQWTLDTPLLHIESLSINSLEVETIPGHTVDNDATVFVSTTYDGQVHGMEWIKSYGLPSHFTHRFILNRMGYVRNWVGIRLRGKSRSRMAFSKCTLDVS